MNLKIAKIDLDIKTKKTTIWHIRERLSYLYDLELLDLNSIEKIVLVKKLTYGCKIYFTKPFKTPLQLAFYQSVLGSDYRKEICFVANYYKFNMKEYPNRLFDWKQYPDGTNIYADKIDITKEVLNYIKDEQRKKYSL